MKLTLFHPDDDFFTDRLCRRYGPLVFVAAALLIAGACLSPWAFSCWTPSHFMSSHDEYSNNICWNTGRFYVAYRDLPMPRSSPHEFNMNRIRFLPIVLILQILVFFIPRVFWKALNTVTGYCTGRIVKASHALPSKNITGSLPNNPSDRSQDGVSAGSMNAGYHTIAAHLMTVLQSPFPFLGGICSAFGGIILVITYFLTKIGYILTSIVQMAIISGVLNVNVFGLLFEKPLWAQVVSNRSEMIYNKTVWYEEEAFPRKVLCDFDVRILGNVQQYTIQCSISANVLVERVMVCLWLWLWFTFLMLSVSTITWLVRLAFYFIAPQTYKRKRVAVLLGRGGGGMANTAAQSNGSDKNLDDFAKLLLKPDGALILEILEDNVSLVAASEIVKAAWMQFQQSARREDQAMQSRTVVQSPYGAQASTAPAIYPPLGGAMQNPNAPETIPLVQK